MPIQKTLRACAPLLMVLLTLVLTLPSAASGVSRPLGTPTPHRDGRTGSEAGNQPPPGTALPLPQHVAYTPTGVEDPRPNIVLITTDDQTLSDMRWMPKTRHWLADQGITFRNMLSPHPLCCPARAELMTGQYGQNNGVHTNAGPFGGLSALKQPDNTLPWWLQQSHFQTAMVGKYLNGYGPDDGVPRGWDYWNAATENSFGYYNYYLYNNGRLTFNGDSSDDQNSSVVIGRDTARLVSEYAADERPFFIWSSYYAPHGVCSDTGSCAGPAQAERKYATRYAKTRNPATRKPSYNEADVSDKPVVIRRQKPVNDRKTTHIFQQRIRALASVDDGVDLTMRTLEETGELDNTLVMFTSDNGYLVGEHRYLGKTLAYEEALRVPLLVRGPHLAQGVSLRQTVTTVDIAPSILDAAQVAPGRLQDGRSILAVARHSSTKRRDETILIQAGGNPDVKVPQPWMYRGVRTDRYTFVQWVGGFVELYDRRLDPFQLRNVSGSAKYVPVQRALANRTRLLKECAGKSCHQSFRPLPSPTRTSRQATIQRAAKPPTLSGS